jgi:hypothetical protein
MVNALAKNSFSTTSQPFVMARMCLFIGKYGSFYESCPSASVFETASNLVMSSFDRSINDYNKHGQLKSTNVSPLSEASNAFKQLLCSSPAKFSTPTARAALENAWKMPYSCHQIAIEDREILCSGLCSVIVSLPFEQWSSSVDALAQPILSCLNVVTREADQVGDSAHLEEQHKNTVGPIVKRLSNEIRLLAALVRSFVEADVSKKYSGEERAKITSCHRNALVSLLHKSWPSLTHISKNYCSYDVIAKSIGSLLTESLSVYGSDEELPLLLEITGLAKVCLIVVGKARNPPSLAPLLIFMQRFIDLHGSKIEPIPRNAAQEPVQVMSKNLMLLAYEAVRSCAKTSQDDDTSQGIASPMFDTLSSCAKKCPVFLISLSRDSQPVGEVICSSLETAPMTLQSNEMEVVMSSIRFLKHLVTSLMSLSLESLADEERATIKPVVDSIKRSLQTDVLTTAGALTCAGVSPAEMLEPLADLMRSILTFSQWSEIESSVSASVYCDSFRLGDEARFVALEAFKKCTESEYITANFGKMISDMWGMHQTDNVGSVAGSEAVLDFVQRYKS